MDIPTDATSTDIPDNESLKNFAILQQVFASQYDKFKSIYSEGSPPSITEFLESISNVCPITQVNLKKKTGLKLSHSGVYERERISTILVCHRKSVYKYQSDI